MKGKNRQGAVPQASVTLRELPGTRIAFWVVGACPWCGGQHFHPAGNSRDDPAERLGEVPAPCDPARRYTLSLPPRPQSRGGKRAQKRRERREGRRLDDDDVW